MAQSVILKYSSTHVQLELQVPDGVLVLDAVLAPARVGGQVLQLKGDGELEVRHLSPLFRI